MTRVEEEDRPVDHDQEDDVSELDVEDDEDEEIENTTEGYTEISYSAYLAYLIDAREDKSDKIYYLNSLLKKLAAALENPRLTVYCYESEDDVAMIAVEKGEMGFGRGRSPSFDDPEGYTPVSITQYQEYVSQTIEETSQAMAEIEYLLQALDEAMENSALRVYFYQAPSGGVVMKTEEKGRMGFIVRPKK